LRVNVLQEFTRRSIAWPDISVQMLPKTSMDLPTISLTTLGAPIFLVFSYVYFLQFLTAILVGEKDTLVKDHMLIMGMRESAYW